MSGDAARNASATRAQYDICKSIYDEEKEHYTNLGIKANLFITLGSFFVGATIFKFDDIKSFLFLLHVPMIFEFITALLLVISLLYTVLAIFLREYQAIARIKDILVEELEPGVTDEAFFGNRIVDLSVATERNAAVNDRVAKRLRVASKFLFAGLMLQILILVAGVGLKLMAGIIPKL